MLWQFVAVEIGYLRSSEAVEIAHPNLGGTGGTSI